MPNRKRLSDVERERRRAEDRRRVDEAARQLLSSEEWQRWVRVRARNGLSRYSLSNQLLIALACPRATFVAGFRAWLGLGYCVRRGERAIRIMASMAVKDRDPGGPDLLVGEADSRARVLFRAVSVFDVSQVTPLESGLPTRLAAPSEPLTPNRACRRAGGDPVRSRPRLRGHPRSGDMSPLRVVIVDDHALFRAGVRSELGDQLEFVGEGADVGSAIASIEVERPDVVLIDVHLPGGGGAEVVRRAPGPRYLALSVSDAPADVIELIQAGARGYVTKTIAPADLLDAIHRVHDGDAVFSPRLAGFVLDAFTQPPSTDPGLESVSPREREVLEYIARGYLYKEIAARPGLSTRTIESHVAAVLRKLQLANRHQLAHWAAQRRLAR